MIPDSPMRQLEVARGNLAACRKRLQWLQWKCGNGVSGRRQIRLYEYLKAKAEADVDSLIEELCE